MYHNYLHLDILLLDSRLLLPSVSPPTRL